MTDRPRQPPPFRAATAVAKLGAGIDDEDAVRERAVWSGAIAPGWDIAANANGGYLLAIAARALSAALDRPDPVTISAHYLAPGKPGRVTIQTQVIKQGRNFGSGAAVLLSGGRPLLSCIGTFGKLNGTAEPQAMGHPPPAMPIPTTACRWLPLAPSRRRSWERSSSACIQKTANFSAAITQDKR